MPIWNSGVEISFTVQSPLIGMLKYFRIWLRFCENILIKKLALHNNLFILAFLFLCIVMCFHILFYPIIPLKVTEVMVKSRKIIFLTRLLYGIHFCPIISLYSPLPIFQKISNYIFLVRAPAVPGTATTRWGTSVGRITGVVTRATATVAAPSALPHSSSPTEPSAMMSLSAS